MGVFSEDLYDYVKKLVDACPEKALIIEKLEKLSERVWSS
jgi:ferredoxin